jgi:hypothetical protein
LYSTGSRPVVGCCECGDGPSGSHATELVCLHRSQNPLWFSGYRAYHWTQGMRANDGRYLEAIKIRSTTSSRGEVESLASYRKILRRVKRLCEYER